MLIFELFAYLPLCSLEKEKKIEQQIDEKTKELKAKDEFIAEKEKILKQKSDSIGSLQSEIAALQRKGASDAEDLVTKAHARVDELEIQVEKLKEEIELKNKEKETLEAIVPEAEKKMVELVKEIENLQITTKDQKKTIQQTERALKIAEDELMKAKSIASSKSMELTKVHGAWLPPWFAAYLLHCQSYLDKHWEKHGKPALEMAIEKKAQVDQWAAPHVETIKTKWIPAMKEQWMTISSNVEPHVQFVTAKMIEVYETSRKAVAPHIIKVQEVAGPYYQDVKRVSSPYVDQVASVARPHFEKVQAIVKPYTHKAIHVSGKFLESATTYHHQVQGTVHETLHKYDLTRALATKELVWFAASALLALPVLFLFKILSACLCGKRQSQSNSNMRRKAKRGHPK
ncbi:hypothetical protein LIER_36147 [Lithospermum erythrorhizon]|uniref:Uncharacterized protein n=1 Tax=Lithospermum erythrorhizon TaxID=34254 RepID=A0AAV3P3H4_LITER